MSGCPFQTGWQTANLPGLTGVGGHEFDASAAGFVHTVEGAVKKTAAG
jgi:hypothetical protein